MASILVGDGCAIAPRGVALGCLALGRDVCAEDTRRQQTQLGGFDNAGQPIILEIDESYFYSRKYHRGRIVNGTGLSSRARLNWGSLCGFCSRGRLTFHRTTWRGTWVSRLGRWSTGPISSDICAEDTRRQQAQVGGFDNAGQPIIIKIDESYFHSRKYQGGRIMNGLWVFGAVERERTPHATSRESQNRSDVVATDPIGRPLWDARHVRWLNGGVYLHDGGVYLNDVVVHQHNFVDPINADVHTKHRESLDEGQTPASLTVRYSSGPLQHLLGGVHVDRAPQEPEAPPSCITRVRSESVPVDRRSSMKNEPNELTPAWVKISQTCSSPYRVGQAPLTVQIISIIMHCIKLFFVFYCYWEKIIDEIRRDGIYWQNTNVIKSAGKRYEGRVDTIGEEEQVAKQHQAVHRVQEIHL